MREKKEREKVLFLRAHGFVARGILVLECALEKEIRTWVEREREREKYNEPAENSQSAGLAVVCICDGSKEMRTLAPVCCREVSRTIKKKKKKIPGNSVREVGERIKGGAVREERSPETEAMLCVCVM